MDEAAKKEVKDILLSYDRTLLVADPRRCEPKKCATSLTYACCFAARPPSRLGPSFPITLCMVRPSKLALCIVSAYICQYDWLAAQRCPVAAQEVS